MRLSLPTITLSWMATSVLADGLIQLRWYNDPWCNSPIGSVLDVTWGTYNGADNCFNFEFGESIEMLYCSSQNGCYCDFYFAPDCNSGGVYRISQNNVCTFTGTPTSSFACYLN
ncbi:hypothetical protein BGZ63DRAFT_460021 [Mariannaea sp. PMI_226]|nr:hypothetical protein BGZ63DRAFT_460021 [Mariannaea sp. PMI_226]